MKNLINIALLLVTSYIYAQIDQRQFIGYTGG
ncbi:MAG: hypothetical protein ACI84C_001633 [Flavobacteriales bacterium]|jgi:hypothetical protein